MTTDLGRTPSQTVGPYFREGLVVAGGDHVVPAGHPDATWLVGRVVDGAGEPVGDALVEVWQLDPAGDDAHRSDLVGFTGLGRVAVEPDGSYRIRVVEPPVTTTLDGVRQAPHLDLVLHARGLMRHLVTRAYVLPVQPGAAASLRAVDPVLSGLGPDRQDRLLARRENGGLRFDIHLQGEHETPFFDV